MGLPTGPAVTFLFTDIEGSTRHERAVGTAAWAAIVARHDDLMRAAVDAAGGVVVKTEGDAFFASFDRPLAAVTAAVSAQRSVAAESWPEAAPIRVRMGMHIGEGRLRDGGRAGDPEDYVGIDVNYTARIAAAGNGGQIVLSDATVVAIGPALASSAPLGEIELVDEGLRAVKDFDEPVRLHRLVVPGAADDPRRLRTIDAPSNLPGDVTLLVGREAEIGLVADAVRTSRIVTLTGPGGSGKTRLALGAARAMIDRFPHGTWFVDLAALRDAELLEATIAATIGIRESSEQAIGVVLQGHLRDRTLLLVLDNLEQLLPAGAEVVSRLVRAAPDLRILVTSRELLRIAGEQDHPVPPLDSMSGVALFEDRARSHRPGVVWTGESRAAIVAICERLAGLPLAIELAAARIRTLSPTQIRDRLDRSLDLSGGARDVPERQRTLRGAITWSHDLLSDPERRLFRRLAAFAGGWTIDEAEAVADADGDLGVDLVDGLESLADKSLVRIGPVDLDASTADQEVRYGLHPLLQEYALERLEESGERPAIEARHAAVITALAESLGGELLSSASETSMRHLDHESHNLRAATDWSLAHNETDMGLRLMGSTWRWFQQRGRLREGRAILADLLARPVGDARTRILGLAAEGSLAYWMDDVPGARRAYEERLALAEETGDGGLIAHGHYDLGFVFMVEGDEELLRYHEQLALDGYLAEGREGDANRARQSFVLALVLGGRYATAREQQEAAIEAFERRESAVEIADSRTLLSAILFRLDEPEQSWNQVKAALEYFAAGQLSSGIARAMVMAAILQLVHGDPEKGTRFAGATYELAREQNVMLAPVTVLHLPDPAGIAVERLGAARAEELMRVGAAIPLERVIDEVLATDASTVARAADPTV